MVTVVQRTGQRARTIEPLFRSACARARSMRGGRRGTLNGEDGIGAIYPRMAQRRDDVTRCRQGADIRARGQRTARPASGGIGEHRTYCQPCGLAGWDTSLNCHALLGRPAAKAPAGHEGAGLAEAEAQGAGRHGLLGGKRPGWAARRLGLPVTKTAYIPTSKTPPLVVRRWIAPPALEPEPWTTMQRSPAAAKWIDGNAKQRTEDWAAFDVNNLEYYLNNIPFSNHGALLDPPKRDVTAAASRCWRSRRDRSTARPVADGGAYLRRTQLSPRGRWLRPLGAELHLRHLVGAVRAHAPASITGIP